MKCVGAKAVMSERTEREKKEGEIKEKEEEFRLHSILSQSAPLRKVGR